MAEIHRLPSRTEYQYRSQLAEDAKQFGEAKFRQGYAVGRWDGYKAAAAFAGPVFLVGVGLGVIIVVVAVAWL